MRTTPLRTFARLAFVTALLGASAAGCASQRAVALADRSLLVAVERDDAVHYRLLETLRQYAAQKCRARGGGHAILLLLAITDVLGAGEFVLHAVSARGDAPSSPVALLYRDATRGPRAGCADGVVPRRLRPMISIIRASPISPVIEAADFRVGSAFPAPRGEHRKSRWCCAPPTWPGTWRYPPA